MATKQGVMVVTIVWETPEGNYPRTKAHMPDRVTEALAKIQNVKMDVAFEDEHTRLRRVELGEGSPELKALAEVEFGPDEALGA